jgi:flagellar protein FliO/FliZ
MITDMYWRFLLALVLVLALIFAIAWIVRRLGLGGRFATPRGKRRLAVVEVLPLDSKRRLMLLKCDGTEHLLLLGPNDDVVVESNIYVGAAKKPPVDFAAALEGTPS